MKPVGATYRMQLRQGVDFFAAAERVRYLSELGVSHLYLSPYLRAATGSEHGYDVADPRLPDPELGGKAGHDHLCEALAAVGLGQVVDLVPNHMAAISENPWWWDVLENGAASRHARYFDIDWDPPERKLRGTVLLAILGDHYGRALEAGELRLEHEAGRLRVRYHEHVFPVAPRSMPLVLEPAAREASSDELAFLSRALAGLPEPGTTAAAGSSAPDRRIWEERDRDLGILRTHLARLCDTQPEVEEAIDAATRAVSEDPDRLDAVLERQHYRLAYWRTAAQELDYRRFFDIDGLIGLRQEDPEVFRATHQVVLDWVAEGLVEGLRIDHPDGLRAPGEYLQRLRDAAPEAWIVVEKITEADESLRGSWPVDGTTGYDFLNEVGGLFVDPAGRDPLTELYVEVTGAEPDFGEVAYARKHQVMRESLAAEVARLADVFVQVCEGNRRYRDFTRRDLADVIREVAAGFEVYRAYVEEDRTRSPEDREVVESAFARASEHRPDLDEDLLSFFRRILLGEIDAEGRASKDLRMRFQQLTGAVAAKGVEDTAFYSHTRLVALNEVGGDPDRFGRSPSEFHARCRMTLDRFPQTMLGLSTHDTKRSEDVRARLFLLSEIPERWARSVKGWVKHNEDHRAGRDLPGRGMEYLLYQTLVGAHPIPVDRLVPYMEKASREAKTHTSWTRPDETYDQALADFVEAVHADPEFQTSLESFVAPLVEPGRANSLAQKLLQLTAPGVPDLYQGTELWDLSLVDPDNRRPVDFDRRERLLRELAEAGPDDTSPDDAGRRAALAMDRADEGLPKLHLIREALRLRSERPRAFGPEGEYEPIEAEGPAAEHLVGSLRGGEVVAAVPRLVLRLEESGGWGETVIELPEGAWRNRLTGARMDGGRIEAARLFQEFPVALLAREDGR